MHTKNTLDTDVLWFVTWRSAGPNVSAHGSRSAAERRKLNLTTFHGKDPDEVHIYAGKKYRYE